MSAPYGELVVVLGDAHVGHRASDIPEKFKKMLSPDKMQHLVSTGNLCASETYDFMRTVAPKMHAVRGDMDDYSSSQTSAEEIVFEVGEFRIGVCHGHQVVPWGDHDALGLVSRRLDVDILLTGHTHASEVFESEGTWFINPGSITGAYTPLRDNVRPSFAVLSIQGGTVKLYLYELNEVSGEVDIKRAKFSKPSKNTPLPPSLTLTPEKPKAIPSGNLQATLQFPQQNQILHRTEATATNSKSTEIQKNLERTSAAPKRTMEKDDGQTEVDSSFVQKRSPPASSPMPTLITKVDKELGLVPDSLNYPNEQQQEENSSYHIQESTEKLKFEDETIQEVQNSMEESKISFSEDDLGLSTLRIKEQSIEEVDDVETQFQEQHHSETEEAHDVVGSFPQTHRVDKNELTEETWDDV